MVLITGLTHTHTRARSASDTDRTSDFGTSESELTVITRGTPRGNPITPLGAARIISQIILEASPLPGVLERVRGADYARSGVSATCAAPLCTAEMRARYVNRHIVSPGRNAT